jgi:predicted TIM-barrel fold metal-dependent hydrolase
MKWLPPVQAIDPADQRLIPFYLRLRELGLPLLTHTGSERSFTRHRDELGDPERLRLPLGLGVEVIAAHAGGNGKTDGERHCEIFLRLCKEFPNLRADLSAMVQPNRFSGLERVLRERELHPRLLYGTDMPLINTPAVTPFAFPLRLGLSKMLEIARVKNPWDRDVALKEALGVTREILANSAKLPDRGARSTSGGPNR